jgi:hypothetical protein
MSTNPRNGKFCKSKFCWLNVDADVALPRKAILSTAGNTERSFKARLYRDWNGEYESTKNGGGASQKEACVNSS